MTAELQTSEGPGRPDKTHWILLYTAGWYAVAVCLILFDRRLWLSSHGRASARLTVAPAIQPTA